MEPVKKLTEKENRALIKRDVLKQKHKFVKEKIGETIQKIRSVKWYSRKLVYIYFLVYFFRRLLLALVIVQYFSNTAMCIIGVIHINFFYTLIFITLKPYKERKETKNEIMNEIAILLMNYTLLLFSEDYVDAL